MLSSRRAADLARADYRSARIRGTRFPLWLGLITAFILAAGAGVSGAVWVNHHHTAPSADPMPALTPMNCPTCVAPQPDLPPTGSGTAPPTKPHALQPAPHAPSAPRAPSAPVAPSAPQELPPPPAAPIALSWGPNPVDAISGGDVPVGLDIPTLGLSTGDFMRLGLNPNHTVQTPPLSAVARVGWLCPAGKAPCGAPMPGEPGPAVLIGHVDGNHVLGVFAKVNQLQPGDLIVVRRANGTQVNFAVTQVAYADKDSFPTQAVYGATDAPELRLITCGGPFDPSKRSYTQNVIVFASQVGRSVN